MNNNDTASSLAIVEKKRSHPGGFVGIFFQLFDWNRRVAKKKIFSSTTTNKLVPTGSRKFGGDDKLPKLRLIANENSGGFPNVKKNGTCNINHDQNPGTRDPGLVARLMGLESLPAVQQDKSKEASFFETGSSKGAKSGFDKEDHSLEKGYAKPESRPQKLQKTGAFERQPLSRFGAEALQFKSVLSRSRKHRPKLASPVKSPRMSSARHTSLLIDAAARILEPGLQAGNRAKCAISYSSTVQRATKDEVVMEGTKAQSTDLSKNSIYHVTTARTLKGQSCKNCGNSLHFVENRPNVEENPRPFASSVSNYVNTSIQGSERSRPRTDISSLEQEKVRDIERSQDQTMPLTAQARNNIRTGADAIANRKALNREGQIQRHLTNQQYKPQKDVLSSHAFKQKDQRQNEELLVRDRVIPRYNLRNLHSNRVSSAANAINESRDFVAQNRSLSNRNRPRIPVKVDNSKCDAERKCSNRQDDSLSQVRKRRSTNVNQRGESSAFVSSSFAKQRNTRRDAMTGKGMGLGAHSMNQTCSRSITALMGETNRSGGNKDNDVISFTFTSPMKQKIGSDITQNSTQKTSKWDKSDRKTCSENSFASSGDALGALIEEKLLELNCQEEDELATGGIPQKRTTAMILQELISALAAEGPSSTSDLAVGSKGENLLCHSGHSTNEKLSFQAKEKTAWASLGYLHEVDHLSPGSVLDASFSNDSCLSSSLDDDSGPNVHPDSMDYSYDVPQPLEPTAELLDSANSVNKERSHQLLVTDLISHISRVLYSISFADSGLKGTKLAHAERVILNAELVFRNIVLQNSNQGKDFSLAHFLIHELETFGNAMWANFVHFMSIEDMKDGNQLKEFLFDCVIEYSDTRYTPYCKSGYMAWTRMPLCMTTDKLISEVVKEVRRWTCFAGKIPDEIIETEMSYSLGKWTDFEIEAYEAGAEIDGDLLEVLIDEIVIDLCEGMLGSSGIRCKPH